VRIPRAQHAPPSLDQERVRQQNEECRGSNPLPTELNVRESRLDLVPLGGERAGGKEKHYRGEAPLRDLEKPTTR
jgi:hypothetical protein